MENYYGYYTWETELYHAGTKGMKWGQRLYQYKDGSLTPLGRAHYGYKAKKTAKKRAESLAKARETRAKNMEAEAKRKKALAEGKLSVKKMTDDELASALKRLETEQRYNQKILETSTAKRFMSKAWNDAVVPGVTEAGKTLVKDFLIKNGSKALGLNEKKTKSAYEQLKEANDMSNWKKNMQVNEDYFVKREEKIRQEAEDRAKAKAKEQVDAYNDAVEKDRWQDEGRYNMKGDGTSKSVPNDIPNTNNKSKTDSTSNTKPETKSESKPRATSSAEAVKQITDKSGNTSVNSEQNKKNVETGEAYVQDSLGRYLATTTYKEDKRR